MMTCLCRQYLAATGSFAARLLLLLIAAPIAGHAQAAPDASQLAQKVANPLSDLVTVPLQVNWLQGVGPDEETRQVINLQPVIPLSLGGRWNLIERVVLPFVSQPDALGAAAGVGDAVVSSFLSPRSAAPGLTWGVGPVVTVPLTSNVMLGGGKWSAGPSAIVMKQDGHVLYGVLANQSWSFADRGAAGRRDVSQMLIQPVVAYVTGGGITVMVMSEATANWKAGADNRWTVPVTAVVSRIMRVGVLPVSLQAGGGVYLVTPDGGPRWQVRAAAVVILPKSRPHGSGAGRAR